MDIINNRQVNLWRGSSEPPTKYHIWIKGTKLLLYDGQSWVVFIDNFESISDLQSAIEELKKITINGISISTNVILDSTNIKLGTALDKYKADTSISTVLDDLLSQSGDQEITISELENGSGVKITIGASSFNLLSSGNGISITKSKDDDIVIKSNALTSIPVAKNNPIQLNKDNELVHKESAVTPSTYGSATQTIKIPIIQVDRFGHIVQARDEEVTLGNINPGSHASTSTTYGVGSLTKYGHVMLRDEALTTVQPDLSNDDINRTIVAVAATPRMVWDTLTHKFSSGDFEEKSDGKIYLAWHNI